MNEQTPYMTSMLCFLAGGAVGVGVSLLLAPQSGKDTRQMMARKLSGGSDSLRGLRDRAVTRGEEAWDEATHRVEGAAAALAGGIERKPGKRSEVPSL